MKKKLFSGVKPTGRMTLGNYIGAVDNWLKLQEEYESVFCVVDLHSLTIDIDPQELKSNSFAMMAFYLACGLDPKKSQLYFQSQLCEHSELCWLLNCVTYTGEANRMTAFKEKAQKGKTVSVALYDYPVLMAADILLHDAAVVPIGEDQRQHLELAATLAKRFNNKYGETFVVPNGIYAKVGAKIYDLQNPTAKMSKSDKDAGGTILLEDEPDVIAQKIKRAVTDSGSGIVYEPKEKPGVSNLLVIYSKMAGVDLKTAQEHFEGKGYGDLKRETAEAVIETLKPIRAKFKEYMNDTSELIRITRDCAQNLKTNAQNKVREVMDKMGIVR